MGRVYHYVLGDDDALTTADTTQFWHMFGMLAKHNTEANTEMMMRTDGTISHLHVSVGLNTINASCMIKVRKNGADTGLTVTVPSSTTGNYKNDTDTVNVSAGDKICLTTVPGSGSTGTIGLNFVRTVFTSSNAAETVTRLAMSSNISNQNGATFSTASTTNYLGLNGPITGTITTEGQAKCRQRRSGSFRNLIVKVRSNARTTDTVFALRKNGSDATNIITVGAGVTGWLEDTTHTDTVTVNDDFNYSITTSTGSGAIVIDYIAVEYVSPNGYGQLVASAQGGAASVAASVNQDYAIAGNRFGIAGLGTFQAHIPQDNELRFSDLTILIRANNLDTDSTFKLRKNNADGLLAATIPANTTGVFSDMTSNKDTTSVDDLINYRLSTGSGAGGDSITVDVISCWTLDATDLPPTTVNAEADISDMATDGEFTVNFTTADDTPRQTVWLALST